MTDASLQPHWMPDVQSFAIQQERDRHLDTIFTYGECSIFVLMWRVEDFEAGLVARCPTCWLPEAKTAEAFGQAKRPDCPDCFGTTFEGGYRAIITRPTLWDHDSTEQHEGPRGDTYVSDARVQTPEDFLLNTDDYIFRRDGTRWQVRKIDWELLRTGFAFPGQPEAAIGWNLTSVDLEDESSIAYRLPPSPEIITNLLTHQVGDHFDGCEGFEDIHGPLDPAVVEHRDIAESASAIDTTTDQPVHIREIFEEAEAIDSVVSSTLHKRSIAESAPAVAGVSRHLTSIRNVANSAPASGSVTRKVTAVRSAADVAHATDSATGILGLGSCQVSGVNVVGDSWGARGMGFEVTASVVVTGVMPQFYSGPDGTAGCRVGIATGVAIGTLCRFPNWLSDGSGHQCFTDIPIGATRADFPGVGFSLVPGIQYTVVVANLSNTTNVATHVVRGSNGTTETVIGVIKNPGYSSVYNGGPSPGSDAGTFTQTGDFPIVFGGGQRGFKLFGHF